MPMNGPDDLRRKLQGMPAGEPPGELFASLLASAPARLPSPRPAASRGRFHLAAAASLVLVAGVGSLLLELRLPDPGSVPGARVATYAPRIPAAASRVAPAEAEIAHVHAAEEPAYDSRGRRDPYVPHRLPPAPDPAPRPRPAIADIELHATVLLARDRYAVFLGADERCYTLREGDRVANGVLRAIDGDRVVFERTTAEVAGQAEVVKSFAIADETSG